MQILKACNSKRRILKIYKRFIPKSGPLLIMWLDATFFALEIFFDHIHLFFMIVFQMFAKFVYLKAFVLAIVFTAIYPRLCVTTIFLPQRSRRHAFQTNFQCLHRFQNGQKRFLCSRQTRALIRKLASP